MLKKEIIYIEKKEIEINNHSKSNFKNCLYRLVDYESITYTLHYFDLANE